MNMKTRKFYLTTFAFVLYSLLITAGASFLSTGIILTTVQTFALMLIVPIVGTLIMYNTDNVWGNLAGLHLIIVPIGIALTPVLNTYSSNVLIQTTLLTGGITLVMGLLGYFKPKWFEGLGGPLYSALTVLILVRVLELFIPELRGLSWIDYLGGLLFSLYIGYDVYLISKVPKSYTEAIRRGCHIYLDILNLFLIVLGGSEDD